MQAVLSKIANESVINVPAEVCYAVEVPISGLRWEINVQNQISVSIIAHLDIQAKLSC